MPKKTVSVSAVEARARRKLARKGELLRKSRSLRMKTDYGDYYTVDGRNRLISAFHDAAKLARETHVLRDDELLSE